jgi:geranylgeranyl diphosphate synthase, type II
MGNGYPEGLRDEVERYLAELRFSVDEAGTAGLEDAMRYSLLAGGKRIRPVLCLATARAVGMEHEDVLPLAAAIELIHTYSLIHDDLPAMDDDELRRGRPTCHVVYGEAVAILAGDGLYAEAFHHLLAAQHGPPERVLAAARELASATGVVGMVGGQYLDIEETRDDPGSRAPASGQGADPAAELRHLHELKTGRLIEASVECVLLLADTPQPATIALRAFARELGVLFQIVDDILDVTGTDADLGKTHGSDQRLGKLTYVSACGLDRARELAGESRAKARAALAGASDLRAGELEDIADFIHTRTS